MGWRRWRRPADRLVYWLSWTVVGALVGMLIWSKWAASMELRR